MIAEGHDFFSSPRISPDGRRLAWLAWDHPDMPWNGTTLWLAPLSPEGTPGEARAVAGGRGESIFQPEWSPGGVLHFASDRSGWWNLYRLEDGEARPVAAVAGDAGVPQWVFRLRRYAFVADGVDRRRVRLPGRSEPADPWGRRYRPRPARPRHLAGGPGGRRHGDLFLLAGSPTSFPAVVRVDPVSGRSEVLRAPEGPGLDPGFVSVPRNWSRSLPRTGPPTPTTTRPPAPASRPLSGRTAASAGDHPRRPHRRRPAGPRPRGAVLDQPRLRPGRCGLRRVHRLRPRLLGAAARHLGPGRRSGLRPGRRLPGRHRPPPTRPASPSAAAAPGLHTTLAALAFRDEFAAGASHFGVADLELLARDTHKFESRYLDWLVGPYPEEQEVYRIAPPSITWKASTAP